MTLKSKLVAILTMWIMITISTVFFIESLPVKLFVLFIGMAGTWVMGFIVPTVKK